MVGVGGGFPPQLAHQCKNNGRRGVWGDSPATTASQPKQIYSLDNLGNVILENSRHISAKMIWGGTVSKAYVGIQISVETYVRLLRYVIST